MKFVVEIEMENDDFARDKSGAVARILHGLSHELQRNKPLNYMPPQKITNYSKVLFDVNGNKVGQVTVEKS